jgi:uncharacterized membrane protein
MALLILGLVLVLGIHSARIFSPDWRAGMIARMGEGPWKLLYSAVSLVGLVLVVWGYGMARQDPIVVWDPPIWTRHLAILLNLVAFIFIAAYLVPAGRIKARLGHPMLLGVKTWAVAHLLANGTLADIVLFGAILAWAVADFVVSRRRDRKHGVVHVAGPARNDLIAVAVGLLAWAVMVLFLHEWLIGVDPLA